MDSALSDPWGGTTLLNGRHPVAMEEPAAAEGTPEKAIFLLLGLFEAMPAAQIQLAIETRLAHRRDEQPYPYAPTASPSPRPVPATLRGYRDGTIFL